MAGDQKLKVGTATTLANANGAQMTSGQAATAGTVWANQTNLDDEGALELQAATSTNAAAGDEVRCYMVPKVDGANVPTTDTSTPYINPDHYIGSFWFVSVATTSQRLTISGIPLQPIEYTVILVNATGKTVSTNWTLKAQGYLRQYT